VGLFDDDYDYEYQPPYYYEVYCKNVYLTLSEDERIMKPLEQVNLHVIQWNRWRDSMKWIQNDGFYWAKNMDQLKAN